MNNDAKETAEQLIKQWFLRHGVIIETLTGHYQELAERIAEALTLAQRAAEKINEQRS